MQSVNEIKLNLFVAICRDHLSKPDAKFINKIAIFWPAWAEEEKIHIFSICETMTAKMKHKNTKIYADIRLCDYCSPSSFFK